MQSRFNKISITISSLLLFSLFKTTRSTVEKKDHVIIAEIRRIDNVPTSNAVAMDFDQEAMYIDDEDTMDIEDEEEINPDL